MDFIRTLFVNVDEKRFRMIWRLVGHLILFTVLAVIAGVVGSGISLIVLVGEGLDLTTADPDAVTAAILGSPLARSINAVGILAAVLGATWAAARLLDRRPLGDFGMKIEAAWWRDLVAGLILGALLMALIYGVERALGWVEVSGSFVGQGGYGFAEAWLGALITFLCVGVYEELLFRGYQMSNLAQGLAKLMGPRFALIGGWLVTSLIFGLAHASNPNATWISTNNIALAGLFLGLAYLLTGRLALPIGLHITWNLFQGNVFGFPVSGTQAGATFIALEQGGPALWTGGMFGPEAGLIGLAAMLLGSGLILLYVRLVEGKIALYLPLTEPPVIQEKVAEPEAAAADR